MTHIDTRLSLFSGEKSTSFLTIDKYLEVKWRNIDTPNTMLGVYFTLSDDKLVYYRKVYSFFGLLEDFGGIAGSIQMIFMPLLTYSSILMNNFLLNNYFAYEHKSAEKSVNETLS